MPNTQEIALKGRSVWEWFRFWWLKVPEPRYMSLIAGALYLVLASTGVITLIYPPMSYQSVFSEFAIQMVGYFLIFGGIVGMVGGTIDFWQLERVGVGSMVIGLSFYLYIILELQIMSDSGNRYSSMGVLIALGVSLFMRLGMIWRYPFKPRG